MSNSNGHRVSFYEHKSRERMQAISTLEQLKIREKDKISIYVNDHANTIYCVEAKKADKTIKRLKEKGLTIRRVL